MKNSKKLLVLIPALGLFLSGCSFQEVKHSIGESWVGQHILHPIYDPIKNLINGGKKEEQKSSEESKKPSEEGGETGGVSFADIEARLKPIAAAFSGKEESELVSLDYDEVTPTSEFDYVTYNKEGLMFALAMYSPSDDITEFSQVYEPMVAQVPAGATLDEEKSEIVLDEYYYSGFYKVDDYYYHVVAYVDDDGYINDFFTILPQSQYDAYVVLMSGGESGGETSETFPLNEVKAALGITDSIPVPTGTSFKLTTYEGLIGYCIVDVTGGSMSAYASALESDGFTVEYDEESLEGEAEKGNFYIAFEGDSDSDYSIYYMVFDESDF